MMGGRRDGGADGGGSGSGTLFSRRDMPRDARGGRRALLDGAKGASAPVAVAPGPRSRAAGKGRIEKEADDGRSWRRVDDTAPRASGMPAWMADDSAASRPVSGVETIEAFKAQMREMERRERGEPPAAAAPPREEAARTDEPETETETETSSRFARFFDTKSDSKAATSTPSSQNIGGLDLFGMFQTLQKRETPSGSAAESPAAHTAPGTPTAPRAVPPAQVVCPTAPAPVRAPAPPAAPSEAPVDGLPKPSAADMASMQMLMAKLMGHPTAPPEAPPGLGPRPPVPPMGLYPRPMPRPAPTGAPMSQMDFLQSLLRTSAPGTPGAAGAPPPPPPPPGLYPAQPPSWPQGAPYAAMSLPPGIPMPMGAPPGLGGDTHGASAGWRPPS